MILEVVFCFKKSVAVSYIEQLPYPGGEEFGRRRFFQDMTARDTETGKFLQALRTGGLEYALMSCDLIRESLVALYSRNAERIPEERREGLEDAVDAVRQIQQALERERSGSDVTLDIGDVNNRISELIDFVVDWQERPLSLGRETTDYEQRDA